MTYSITNLEEAFNCLLQRDIVIRLNDKTLREGKLVLFCIKNFYLVFSLSQASSGRMLHYELPVPFAYDASSSIIKLSYRLKYFHQDDVNVKISMQLLSKSKVHKIYDRDIFIAPKN